jgi:two-component system sensor histidine kinase KdpD
MDAPDHDDRTEIATARPLVRVLVAVGINPNSDRLLRRAAKLADGLGGDLLAVHVHQPGEGSSVYEANVHWHLEKARQLGAQVEVVEGSDVAAVLVDQVRKHGATHLVIGQSDITRWQEVRHGSIINRIMRYRSGVDLYIVTDPGR